MDKELKYTKLQWEKIKSHEQIAIAVGEIRRVQSRLANESTDKAILDTITLVRVRLQRANRVLRHNELPRRRFR